MPFTEAAKKHLATLAERGVKADKKANEGERKGKTTTKRKPRAKTIKKA